MMCGWNASFMPTGTTLLGGELEMPDRVGAGLEQQLRGGVEEHAGKDEREGERAHAAGAPSRTSAAATLRPSAIRML